MTSFWLRSYRYVKMLKLEQAIITEGRYDKIRLANIVDALIITTEGFRIFSDPEKREFIRRLADTVGIIVLTDSDAAGFRIRSYIQNIAPDGKIINAYIPDICGKERRKTQSSAEGKLGVEGVADEIILDALKKAIPDNVQCAICNVQCSQDEQGDLPTEHILPGSDPAAGKSHIANCKLQIENKITVADLYAAGLTGTKDARERRAEYLRSKGLPERMSVSSLLKYLNQTGGSL